MKFFFNFLLSAAGLLSMGILAAGFWSVNDDPNQTITNISLTNGQSHEGICTDQSKKGITCSNVHFRLNAESSEYKTFYGHEIQIFNHAQIDRIRIGITNNLITRIEIWKADCLLESKELGFVGKMTRGTWQNIQVKISDSETGYPDARNNISLRFFEGSGFWGDIGTIQMDLSKYDPLTQEKYISLFATSLENQEIEYPEFDYLALWQNYNELD